MRTVSEYSIDETYECAFHINAELHQSFVRTSGDDSPIHTDLAFCQANGYDRLVGHAFLITTLLSQIYGKKFPGGNELCVSHTANFRRPFFVADTLNFQIKVTGRNESLDLLHTRVTVTNQKSEKIFTGDGLLKLSLKA